MLANFIMREFFMGLSLRGDCLAFPFEAAGRESKVVAEFEIDSTGVRMLS